MKEEKEKKNEKIKEEGRYRESLDWERREIRMLD